jgi:hypothetical protein
MENDMRTKTAAERMEEKLVKELVEALRGGRAMRGSVVTMRRKCGGKNCRCTHGHLHESFYVGQGKEGTTRMAYVPSDWEKDVQEWLRRYQRVKTLLERLSQRAWRALRRRER